MTRSLLLVIPIFIITGKLETHTAQSLPKREGAIFIIIFVMVFQTFDDILKWNFYIQSWN